MKREDMKREEGPDTLLTPLAPADCPACESPIPPHLIFSRFEFGGGPATKTVTINCPHCDAFFERDFELRGGVWSPLGSVRRITDRRTLAGLNRRVDAITNTTRAVCA